MTYAHNQCPLCFAIDKSQSLGRLFLADKKWTQRRTCSECKTAYDYNPIIVRPVYTRENGKWQIVRIDS